MKLEQVISLSLHNLLLLCVFVFIIVFTSCSGGDSDMLVTFELEPAIVNFKKGKGSSKMKYDPRKEIIKQLKASGFKVTTNKDKQVRYKLHIIFCEKVTDCDYGSGLDERRRLQSLSFNPRHSRASRRRIDHARLGNGCPRYPR